MKQKVAWGKLYLGLVFIILYAPILYLMIFSFSSGKTMEHYHGFSLQHYADLFADSRMITIVINTVLVAVLSSLIATIIGTLGALAIKETRGTWRNSLLSLNNVLMVSPDVIIGASFLIFFTVLGIRNATGGERFHTIVSRPTFRPSRFIKEVFYFLVVCYFRMITTKPSNGPCRTRTYDRAVMSRLLYQLS